MRARAQVMEPPLPSHVASPVEHQLRTENIWIRPANAYHSRAKGAVRFARLTLRLAASHNRSSASLSPCGGGNARRNDAKAPRCSIAAMWRLFIGAPSFGPWTAKRATLAFASFKEVEVVHREPDSEWWMAIMINVPFSPGRKSTRRTWSQSSRSSGWLMRRNGARNCVP